MTSRRHGRCLIHRQYRHAGASAADTTLGGYSVIRATSLDAAVDLARGCPILSYGGAVEVEVIVHVEATPRNVFPYFTDPARYVQWMGSQATLDAVAGGTYRVHMSDGFQAAGTFLLVDPPHQLAFTWGFADDDAAQRVLHKPAEASGASAMPAGSTRVTVTLEAEDGGTCVTLRHDDLASDELRHGHRIAWQAYLQRLVIRAAGGDPGPDPHA